MKKILLTVMFMFFSASVYAYTFPVDLSGCVVNDNGRILLTGWFDEYRPTGKHNAIDIPANLGTNVRAFVAGKVVAKIYQPPRSGRQSYGNCIVIEDAQGLRWYYAHLLTYEVLIGQEIREGQYIGQVGYTGMNYVCPHLHIECRDARNVRQFFTDDLGDAARLILPTDPGEFTFDLRQGKW